MTAAAPTPDRPEGGWQPGDVVVLVPLDRDAFYWYRRDVIPRWTAPQRGARSRLDHEIDQAIASGRAAWLHAPRGLEPEPVTEPLPTTLSAIRATACGVESVVLVGPDPADDEWFGLYEDGGFDWYRPKHITAWEPLLSRAEWEAGQDGDTVRVPREAVERLRILLGNMQGVRDFLATLNAERGDQA